MKNLSNVLEFTKSKHNDGKDQFVNEAERLKIKKDKSGFWRGYFKPEGASHHYAMGWVSFEDEDEALDWIANAPKRRAA